MSESFDAATRHARVVPVVVTVNVKGARKLAAALAEGGIRCAEITLRTDSAIEAIRSMAAESRIAVGAGTVTTPDQVDRAVEAGARFIVSPGLAVDVVERAASLGVPIAPGVATASELQAAIRLGLDLVKLFPAQSLGGVSYLSALSGPFPSARFMPSGGITEVNAALYLGHPAVSAVGGSWMVPGQAVALNDFDTIRELAARAARLFELGPAN